MSLSDEVSSFKNKLDNDETSEELILDILKQLEQKDITEEIIRKIRIGQVVGKLRKHENADISDQSTRLVEKWKKLIPQKKNDSNSQDENITQKDKRKQENKGDDKLKITIKKQKNEPDVEEKKKKENKSSNKSRSSGDDDKTRDRIIDLLAEALGSNSQDHLEAPDVAREIEDVLFKKHGGVNQAYKAKFRSLQFNLKNPKNPDLRHLVMQGTTSAEKLCTMSANEMASEELKETRKKAAQYHLEASQTGQGNVTTTDMFKCNKCGKRETTYYQLQTRSADEPMTTFHTCCRCGNRWKS